MGGRDTQVTVYVTDERKTELEERADEADTSLSGIINDTLDKQLQQDAQEAIASETRAEERIQELLTVGTEEMVETAREIREMNAKFGAYAIANFELMKHEQSDHIRKDALKTGARRIRQDLDTGIHDLDEEASPPETDRESTTTAPTTMAPDSATSDSHVETSQQSGHSNEPDSRQTDTETPASTENSNSPESVASTANDTENSTKAEPSDERDGVDESGDGDSDGSNGSDLFDKLRRGRR